MSDPDPTSAPPIQRPLEGAFITTFGWQILADQDGLDALDEEVAQHLHLYAVCRRPRIAAVPSEWRFTKERVFAVFTSQHGEELRRIEVDGPNRFEDDEVKITCEYPYTWVELEDSQGQIAGGRAAFLLPLLAGYRPELDLDVLYVGQAYGEEGARSARDRLASHSTLQAIYAEAISRAPDHEVWLLLLGLNDPYAMIQIGPHAPVPFVEPTEEELASDFARLTTPITEQQRINLAEACLIKYFSPEYNSIYKERFPSPAHKTYAECYELDLNTVGFELETSSIAAQLYSSAKAPAWIHAEVFPLHSEADRRRMFDFSAQPPAS